MNPIALYLASGESLYAGVALLLLVVGVTPWVRELGGGGGRWWVRGRMLGVWVGLALVVMACPPLSWVMDGMFVVALAAWLVAWGGPDGRTQTDGRGPRPWRVARVASAGALGLLLIAFPAMELPWRGMPVVRGARADHLVVMGDSISAGIADEDSRWPLILEKTTGIPVTNLSQPGAEVADALAWTKRLSLADTLVLIEIGGNDLIGGTPAADFDRALDALLAACTRPGRTLVMFELPLLPHRIGYGRSQRRLAEKYGVVLIPKRRFTDVLGGGGATSDGVHLSPDGARAMAALVRTVLAPVMHTQASP